MTLRTDSGPQRPELAVEDVVRLELLLFNWSNFGLDAVTNADDEWADQLADRIVYVLKREKRLP